MPYFRQQNGTERRVDLRNFNKLIGALKRGEHIGVHGPGMKLDVRNGKAIVHRLADKKPAPRPFEPRILERANRKVRVAAGVCYVYGVAFEVDQTDVILDTGSTRIWVQFPITPGTEDEPTIEFGTAADVANVDRNTHAFRVLAHVEMAVNNGISVLDVRWFAGDVYFDD